MEVQIVKPKQEKINNQAPVAARQPYEKPRLRAIELISEEVLATGCKMDDGFGGFNDACALGFTCSSEPGS
jgi:hypothetical protein